MEEVEINRDKAARLILTTLRHRNVSQGAISRITGIDRPLLTKFLNRKLDLLPKDIERILNILEIKDYAVMLSALPSFQAAPNKVAAGSNGK